MAIAVGNAGAARVGGGTVTKTDVRAMSVATALFFMVGFLTCLNDVIIPHLKSIFELNYAEALLVQFAFFTSYFVFSYPGGALVDRFGYKKTMVVGLLVMALGAAGFIPAAKLALFPVFLMALIVLAAGMTVVQVAVNPYVTIIGPPATASSRLNLAQAFNSVGTFIAPFIGGLLILRGAAAAATPERLRSMGEVARQAYRAEQASTVRMPYIAIALTLVLLAVALAAIKLQTRSGVAENTQDFRPGAYANADARADTIWNHRWLLFGALGIFTYVGAEVTIGSLLVNYMGLPQIAGLRDSTAANFLMVYWGGAMLGRFAGSAALQRFRTGLLLAGAAVCAFALVMLSMNTHYAGGVWVHPAHVLGWNWMLYVPQSLPMWTLLAVGFCNSIMFPSIFTLGIEGLGALTSKGSSLLIAAIVGGALLPLLAGVLADHIGLQMAFIVPAICYLYIGAYGFLSLRRPTPATAFVPVEPV